MGVRFANSYIDRAFAEKDLEKLHHMISLVGRDRQLPEEFWLFCRIFEWAPSRSGVWQYYECLPDDEFTSILSALERFGLSQIAEKYRLGKETSKGPDQAEAVDVWLEEHFKEVHQAVFGLVAARKESLKCGS